MNEKLIQHIFHLSSQMKEQKKGIDENNAFLSFLIEYEYYFNPIYKDVVPKILEHVNLVKRERKEQYFDYIDSKWLPLIDKKLKQEKLFNAANHHICEYLVKDLTIYLEAYELKDDRLHKLQFIKDFTHKKSDIISKIIRDDFELGLRTISLLKCPKIQLDLIHSNKYINSIFKEQFSSMSEMERLYFLSQYFCYTQSPEIDEYFQQWIGHSKIHIKFCREILGSHYKQAKKFLKGISSNE